MPEKEIILKRVSNRGKPGNYFCIFPLRSLFHVFSILLYMAVPAFSQSNVWPFIFQTNSDSIAGGIDSSSLKASNKFSVYDIVTNKSAIEWRNVQQQYLLEQICDYSLIDYDYNTRNHIMDLSGRILWKSFPFPGDSFGVDWTPIASYNDKDSGSTFYSMADIGPVLKTRFYGLPVEIKMGLSGYGWNDGIEGGISGTPLSDYQGDPGYYGGLSLGGMSESIGSLPLYLSFKSIGKVIQSNGLGVIMGSVLYKNGLGSGDSLFLYAGDSLSNGKEIYLQSNIGNDIYTSAPWRIRHSLSASGAFKAVERLGLSPALVYSFNLNSMNYPNDTASLDNVRTTSHTVIAQIHTADWLFIHYSGGLELTWLFEDRLFNQHPSGMLDQEEIPALYFDYHGDMASSDHELRIDLPRNMALEYSLNAFKDSRKYDLLHTVSGEIANPDENDHVRILHHAGITFDSLRGFSLQPYGEYARTYLYKFRAANSGSSRKMSEYRLGLNASFKKGDFYIHEKLYGEAEVTDYKFKDAHRLDPPPYSRRVSSTLTGNWDLNKIHLSGSWNQIYHDDGKWYDRVYYDTIDIAGEGYYAIERKSDDYTIQFYATFLFDAFNVVLGSSLYNYKQYDFLTEDMVESYIIEPSMKLRYFSGAFGVDGKIGRIFNTVDSRKNNFRRNWDISLSLTAEFK